MILPFRMSNRGEANVFKMATKFVLLFLLFFSAVECHRILFAVPFSLTRSHQNSYIPLIKALAQRDHHVTLITNFPVTDLKSSANVRQIEIEALRVKKSMFNNLFKDAIDRKDSLYDKVSSQIDSFTKLVSMNVNIAKAMYSNEEIKQLVKDESFDMVVVSQFFGGAAYPLAWHFNATLATISPVSFSLK